MKKRILHLKKFLIGCGILLGSAPAFAADGGLFVEPAITYEKGDHSVNWPTPVSDSTGSADGLGIGARLGFHVSEAFFLALEGRYSMPQFKDSSANYNAKAVGVNYGPVVGFQMPDIGLRIWGAYTFGSLDPEADGNLDVKFDKGAGYRVGAGFRVLAFSVNLEYQQLKYDDVTLEKVGPFTPGTFGSTSMEDKAWIASVSFPMEF